MLGKCLNDTHHMYREYFAFLEIKIKLKSRSGDTGKRMYMYTLTPFMDEVLSEERQLKKWVGIF